MGRKVNSNIIRIVNNNEWKSKYFEKKATDSPVFEVKDIKIRDFIFKFFKNNKFIVNNCNIFYFNNKLHISLSYYQNYESLYLIKKISTNQKIKLKLVKSYSKNFKELSPKKDLKKNYYKFINYKKKLKEKVNKMQLNEKYLKIKIKKMLNFNVLLKKEKLKKLIELINKNKKGKVRIFNEIKNVKKKIKKQQTFLKKFIKIKMLKKKIINNKLLKLSNRRLKKKINSLLEFNNDTLKKKINSLLEFKNHLKKKNSDQLIEEILLKKIKNETRELLLFKKKRILKLKNIESFFANTLFYQISPSKKHYSVKNFFKKKFKKLFDKITLKKLKVYLYYYVLLLFKKELLSATKDTFLKYNFKKKLKNYLTKSFLIKKNFIKFFFKKNSISKIKQKNLIKKSGLIKNILKKFDTEILNKMKLELPGKIFKLFEKRKLKKKNRKLCHRLVSLTKYKQFLSIKTNSTVKNIKHNRFIENFFESLSKFLKNKVNLKLIVRPLNKEIHEKMPDLFKIPHIKKTLSHKLRRFIKYKHSYVRETLNTLFTCLNIKNSANLLATLISTQIGKLRKSQLKKHHQFVNFVNTILKFFFSFATRKNVKKWKIKGIRIKINGRFNRAPRSVERIIKIGKKFPMITLKSDITYAESTSYAVNGTLGVKVWLLHWDSEKHNLETYKKPKKIKKVL